jgi:uncharacterized protein (DUF924 family)
LAAPQRRWAAEILHFWFHQLAPAMWFAPDTQVDALLARRFSHELSSLRRRPAREFLSDPLTALAAVLLFDQLPRNLHRGTPQAFASDTLARAISKRALARGWDVQLGPLQRQFLAMPLMHSERIADQRRSLAYFTRLGPVTAAPFARAHHRMIARFGRFPASERGARTQEHGCRDGRGRCRQPLVGLWRQRPETW